LSLESLGENSVVMGLLSRQAPEKTLLSFLRQFCATVLLLVNCRIHRTVFSYSRPGNDPFFCSFGKTSSFCQSDEVESVDSVVRDGTTVMLDDECDVAAALVM